MIPAAFAEAAQAGLTMAGPPSSVYYTWGETTKFTSGPSVAGGDATAALVKDPEGDDVGLGVRTGGGCKCVTTVRFGSLCLLCVSSSLLCVCLACFCCCVVSASTVVLPPLSPYSRTKGGAAEKSPPPRPPSSTDAALTAVSHVAPRRNIRSTRGRTTR